MQRGSVLIAFAKSCAAPSGSPRESRSVPRFARASAESEAAASLPALTQMAKIDAATMSDLFRAAMMRTECYIKRDGNVEKLSADGLGMAQATVPHRARERPGQKRASRF